MGNLSVILALSAILVGGAVIVNMQRTTRASDEVTTEYQHQVLAREAASAGLNLAVRDLARNALATGTWGTISMQDVPHDGGSYTVNIRVDECDGLTTAKKLTVSNIFSLTPGNLIEVTSRGTYDVPYGASDAVQSHQIRACYVRSVSSAGTPPAFLFAFISNETFDFNGGPDIISVEVDGEGNVHTNADMELGPQVDIDGHATYVDSDGSSVHKNTDVYSHGEGSTIPLVEFDPEVYRPVGAHSRMDNGFTLNGGVTTIGSAEVNTEDNPFIWFVDGDLTLTGESHLILPGYTIIVTTGAVDVSGNANVTAVSDLPPDQASEDEMRTWIEGNLTDDGKNKIAFYANGDASISGTGQVVGNFYTNGDFTLNGGGNGSNLVGGVAALGTITANGGGNGNNFWYTGLSESVIIPGVNVPGLNTIAMVAISEWTDSVLDHVGP